MPQVADEDEQAADSGEHLKAGESRLLGLGDTGSQMHQSVLIASGSLKAA
jgi:hypothetical protein